MTGPWAFAALLGLSTMQVASAQDKKSTAFTDEKTGIVFQKYTDTESGFGFGMALPTDKTSTDFIGQLSGNGKAQWAGVSMNGQMANALLPVAFPNTDRTAVLGSLRMATGYTNPAVHSGSGTLKPIPDGTSVGADGWSYTFLCSGCLADAKAVYDTSSASGAMGMALSAYALDDASKADARLNQHTYTGGFGIDLDGARSAEFAKWAALASSDNATTTPAPGGTDGYAPTTPAKTPASTPATTSNETWDYIVAGGGPAGIVAATRFAEAGHSVLLLERGPASFASTGGKVPLSWNASLTPMDIPGLSFHLSGIEGMAPLFCSDIAGMGGCLLGGGTAVNGLQWFKPASRDFDDKWPAGWKATDMAAAEKAVYERNPGTTVSSADGKLYDQAAYEEVKTLLDANGYQSINANEDVDTRDKVYTNTPWNVVGGLRAGPVRTYLPVAEKLPNFKLQLDSLVLRVLRNGSAATGVEVELGDKSRQIINLKPGGKVVLASGTLSTPRILFRSGIGPAAQIQAVENGSTAIELPPKADWIELPVGKFVQDHNWIMIKATTAKPMEPPTLLEKDFVNPSQENIDLFNAQTGPLVQGSGRIDFFDKVTHAETATDRYLQITASATNASEISFIMQLVHGLDSSGELGITAQGATEFVKTPWLNTDADRAAVTAQLEKLLGFMKTPESNLKAAEEYVVADLVAKPTSAVHFVGSCRLGDDDGRVSGGRAVVDLDAKVYGTDNLYVVDASIHPDLPSGNTQAIIMVVAEKASAAILKSAGGTSKQVKCKRGTKRRTRRQQ